MARSFTITAESASKRSISTQCVDGLSISKTIFHPGYWFVTEYHMDVPINDLSSKHFVVSGRFTETSGTIPDRCAGYKTWEDPGMMPAGVWNRGAPDGCEMWCVWNKNDPQGRVDHVHMVNLLAGQDFTVPDQSNLFSAFGVLRIGDRVLEDEKPYVLRSGARTVTAVQDAYFLHWPVSAP